MNNSTCGTVRELGQQSGVRPCEVVRIRSVKIMHSATPAPSLRTTHSTESAVAHSSLPTASHASTKREVQPTRACLLPAPLSPPTRPACFRPDFNLYARERLANRCFEKRDLIMILIENYIINSCNSQSYELLHSIDASAGLIEKPIVQLMNTRRQLRSMWQGQQRQDETRGKARLAEKLNVEQLNALLHYLDNTYRDISEVIMMNTKINLAVKQPMRRTVDQLLLVFRTLLSMTNYKS